MPWTMPLAFGLPYKEFNTPMQMGAKVEKPGPPVSFANRSEYAYLIRWDDLLAPAALYELLRAGIAVKASTGVFDMNVDGKPKKFNYGSLMIPVKYQQKNSDAVWNDINRISDKYGLKVYAVTTGNVNSGVDLGSARFVSVTTPSIAMIVGGSVNATDAGEVWHLLDQRMNIPSTHLEPAMFNQVDLSRYNTIIMVGGNYPDINKEKLRT